MTPSTMTPIGSAHVYPVLPASDLARARAFYHDTLGFEVKDMPASHQFLIHAGEGTALVVYETSPTKAEHTVATIVVDDLSSGHERPALPGRDVRGVRPAVGQDSGRSRQLRRRRVRLVHRHRRQHHLSGAHALDAGGALEAHPPLQGRRPPGNERASPRLPSDRRGHGRRPLLHIPGFGTRQEMCRRSQNVAHLASAEHPRGR